MRYENSQDIAVISVLSAFYSWNKNQLFARQGSFSHILWHLCDTARNAQSNLKWSQVKKIWRLQQLKKSGKVGMFTLNALELSTVCMGAIDGKHITIQASFNHRSTLIFCHSIVLMAVSDAHYCFWWMYNVDDAGRHSNTWSILNNSEFGQALLRGNLNKIVNFPYTWHNRAWPALCYDSWCWKATFCYHTQESF